MSMHDIAYVEASGRPVKQGIKVEGALACLLPWLIATVFSGNSDISWWISWFGSWFIVVLVFTGRVFTLPKDRPMLDQVMRPWFLMHLVFAGYNYLSAIFYWFDLNGITLGLGEAISNWQADRELAAKAQRLYVLAHAGLVVGIGMVRQVPKKVRVTASAKSLTKVLVIVALGSAALEVFMNAVPGLSQFGVKLQGLFIVAAAVSLGVAMKERSPWLPGVMALNFALFAIAMISGWKGGPIVMVILIASAFYPRAPLRTLFAAGVVFLIGVFVLPTISNYIRSASWSGEMSRSEAFQKAVVELGNKPREDVLQDSWAFLAQRLSEEGLFVRYLEQVPTTYPYYGTTIVSQAVMSVVPRILWPEKVDLEALVRERVLAHDIVEREVEISAKPQYVVDAYLSGGTVAVFIAMFLYGVVAQIASNTCSSWLGGYLLGGVAFNGLFTILWQGSAFEFVFNAVFWSFIFVFILYYVGRSSNLFRQ